MVKPFTFLMFCAALGAAAAVAAQEQDAPRIDDTYGDAFVNYQPYVVKGQKPPKKVAPPPGPQATQAKPQESKEQTVDVRWLRENYPLLEERAINSPTEENVSAYLYVRRIVMDKSQRFSNKVMEVTNADPLINENSRIPIASAGALSVRNAKYSAQKKAVIELSQAGGLIVFVDGTCRFCAMQMPILSDLKREYNMDALIISLDGKRPAGYDGPIVRDNGLFSKLSLKLTPSVVYVHKPRGYRGGKDPNAYRTVAQGFYARDELVKQLAFAGFQTDVLSASTTRDLNVWDRGVASVADLDQLKLDPNRPEMIRDRIQPILHKQYSR